MRPSKLRLPESTATTARSLLGDRGGDLLRQRPAVADAGRAAVADEVEAELVEVLGQPGAVEVLGDDLRARRERGLDPRLDASGPRCTALRASSPAPSITDGFEVFVQLVIAAITTWPWSSSVVGPVRERRRRHSRRAAGDLGAAGPPLGRDRRRWARGVETGSEAGKLPRSPRPRRPSLGQHSPRAPVAEGLLGLAQRDAVLRALRARRCSARPSPGRARARR